MSLWAHTIVKNEDRYLWYAVNSIIDYVDRILIWDTGSADNTVEIIKLLKDRYPKKVIFKEVGEVNPTQFTRVRQDMLKQSKCDWVLILDGDEVWWDEKIHQLKYLIDKNGKTIDSVVLRYRNIVGDIFHYQDESAGRYNIDGKIGNFNIRAFNRHIKGIKFLKPHGQQGIVDEKGILIQDRDSRKRAWIENYSYLHFTNMARSIKRANDLKVPKRDFKLKYEIGRSFPLNFYYPEVFFKDKPKEVKDVWVNMNKYILLKAILANLNSISVFSLISVILSFFINKNCISC